MRPPVESPSESLSQSLIWALLAALVAPLPGQALTKAELALVETAITELSATDDARRLAALDRLAELAPRIRSKLDALLADRDPAVRHAALLVYRRAPESADPRLVAALVTDADARVREAAVLLLADLKPDGWTVTACGQLAREADARVVRQIVVALGASEDMTVVPALIDALEFQRDDFLRGKLAQSLTALTGEAFGSSVAAWREWWKATDRINEWREARRRRGEVDPKSYMGAKPK